MIDIGHDTYNLLSKSRDILDAVRLNSTNFRWLFGNKYFFWYSEIDKQWYGQVSYKNKEFEIRRNGLGPYLDKISAIIVEGTVTEEGENSKLNIVYRLSIIRSLFFIAISLGIISLLILTDEKDGVYASIGGIVFLIGLTIWDYWKTRNDLMPLLKV